MVIWETVICTHHSGETCSAWASAALKHMNLSLNLLVTKELKQAAVFLFDLIGGG